ncbi:MAG: Cu(I)/Ag(I) efflux system membrane protein CusA/SilA, partial [Myxococcota bacterium]
MTRIIRYLLDNPLIPWVLVILVVVVGWQALVDTPVDAIPDISENQTIVFTQWPGRSPQDVENQVTYPLSSELQGIPGVKEVRGLSGFGFSQIYVVFEEDTPFYWARTRVLERLSTASGGLPPDAKPKLGPDATAIGQVFWYTLEGDNVDLATLRTLQDYVVRYALQAVKGVSEVASIGGFVRQYQVDVDPRRLAHYGLDVADVQRAVSESNLDVGAKTLERSGMEFVIRGLGFIKTLADVENIVISSQEAVPVFLKHVANVTLGPDFRRGALADEKGERVGGVVTMRFGDNPRRVIEGVREAIDQLGSALPKGVRIVPFYDRTQLVDETIGTLRQALLEEIAVTLVVILLFLLNVRASLIVAVTLPLAVLMAFIAMRWVGVGSNIMSLAGIAIAIGTMVDMGIVMSENIFSRLLQPFEGKPRAQVVAEAAGEVAPAIITAVATTVVSFIPVFFLTGQAHKLFAPLAWTKSFALVAALLAAIVVVPLLCHLFLRDGDDRHRLGRFFRWPGVALMAGVGVWLGSRLPALGVFEGAAPIWPAL